MNWVCYDDIKKLVAIMTTTMAMTSTVLSGEKK